MSDTQQSCVTLSDMGLSLLLHMLPFRGVSVCLSVCHIRALYKMADDNTISFSYDSHTVESLGL